MKLHKKKSKRISSIVGVLTVSIAGFSANAAIILHDDFTDPALPDWNLTTSEGGSVTAGGGRMLVDAADTGASTSWGSFGVVSANSFTRNLSGQGNRYVYFWEVDQTATPTYYYLGVTESSSQPTGDSDFELAGYARAHSSPPDIQEVSKTPGGSAGNWALAGSAGGPLEQPAPGVLYDYRIVLRDQGADDSTTEINLEYKLSSSATWIDFVNTNEGTRDFADVGAALYVGIMPRDHAASPSHVALEAITIADDDWSFLSQVPEPATFGLLLFGAVALARSRRFRRV